MSQILSQSEVDALLKGISGGEIETEKGIVPEEGSETAVYDLTKPDKAVRLPKLVVITDKFSRTFRITLSNTIRKLAEVSFESTDVKRFDDFLKEIPVPANINIFIMEPLRGFNILLIDSVLVFYFVDVLFGGTGSDETKVEGREFTSIETTVIKKIARTILAQLGGKMMIAMTGAYNLIDHGNALSFRIRGSRKVISVRITLNPLDLYDIEFANIRGVDYKVVGAAEGVYADMLRRIIETETGLYLSL